MPGNAAPILIALPQGFSLGGVTSWAMRLARGAVEAGRRCAIIAHEPIPASGALPQLQGVEVVMITGAAPLDACAGSYAPYVERYLGAIDRLAPTPQAPVVVLPNLSAESYGLAAHLTRLRPGLLRIACWTHSDIAHDYRIAEHYEPVIARFAGVSDHITRELQRRIQRRAADIARIWYGVETPPHARRARDSSRPIRLIYAGRFDHFQKRILALPRLSRALLAHGISHSMELIGEGPSRAALVDESEGLPITIIPSMSREALSGRLVEADIFVLPSRFEGLSIAMIEAMAHGCVPVVTRIASGAQDAIEDGRSGVLVEAASDASESEVGKAMARGVKRALALGLPSISAEAMRCAAERFCVESHLEAARALIDDAAASPARDWPSDRSPAAADASGFGFSVPPDAASRAAGVLQGLSGRAVALWGSGRHTRAIAPILAASPARIVAIIDDDASHHRGTLLGAPIVAAAEAARLGATDVVISSALHEQEMWSRRAPLEALGLRVHRIYEEPTDALAA